MKPLLIYSLLCCAIFGFSQSSKKEYPFLNSENCDTFQLSFAGKKLLFPAAINPDSLVGQKKCLFLPKTVTGRGSDLCLEFNWDENRQLIAKKTHYYYYGVNPVYVDTILKTGTIDSFISQEVLCGHILTFDELATTIAFSDNQIIREALVPVDSLTWFFKRGKYEYLFVFQQDPFIETVGEVRVYFFPELEFAVDGFRDLNFMVTQNEYGRGFMLSMKDIPGSGSHRNYLKFFFQKEFHQDRVGYNMDGILGNVFYNISR